jgi:hypothetical protein
MKKLVEITIFLIDTRACYTMPANNLNKLLAACILKLPISYSIKVTISSAA